MDISGLESLIRTHPGLSLGIGTYIACVTASLCLVFSERRKRRVEESKIRFYSECLRRYIDDYVSQHPKMSEDPLTKFAYATLRVLEED